LKAIFIYRIVELKNLVAHEIALAMQQRFLAGQPGFLQTYGNSVEAMLDYWFRHQLDHVCCIFPAHYHLPSMEYEVRRLVNQLPSYLDTLLYDAVQVPIEFNDRPVRSVLTKYDLYLFYD